MSWFIKEATLIRMFGKCPIYLGYQRKRNVLSQLRLLMALPLQMFVKHSFSTSSNRPKVINYKCLALASTCIPILMVLATIGKA